MLRFHDLGNGRRTSLLSRQQTDILNALDSEESFTYRELADFLNISEGTTHTQLWRLKKKRFVSNKEGTWHITGNGKTFLRPKDVKGPTEEESEILPELREFYESHLTYLESNGLEALPVDYALLDRTTDLDESLIRYPIEFFDALRTIMKERGYIQPYQKPFIKIFNLPDDMTKTIFGIREDDLGELVQFEGEIISHTHAEVAITKGMFECKRCGATFTSDQKSEDGSIQPPLECPQDQGGCGKSASATRFEFHADKSGAKSYQWLRVQERVYDQADRPTMDVYIDTPLMDSTDPKEQLYKDGNIVKVVGVVKGRVKSKKNRKKYYSLYVDASSVEVIAQAVTETEPTPEQVEKILELSKEDDIEVQIVQSICPELEGYERVKKLVALMFFSGKTQVLGDGTRVRKSPNVIMLGEIGCGKSTLQQWIANFYPKSGYSSGKGATPAGLWGMAARDDLHGSHFTFITGLIPRCNEGIACVDEFDKHLAEYGDSLFLEQMEMRKVTIHKGDIRNLVLEADCPLICGANWKGGKFDTNKYAVEQIPDEINMMLQSRAIMVNLDVFRKAIDDDKKLNKIGQKHGRDKELLKTPIAPNLFRAYISYARRHVDPNVYSNEEVFSTLKATYLDLMKQVDEEAEELPLTDRLFEDLIRFTECSARMHLRDIPTEADIQNGIEAIKHYLWQFAVDEFGKFDIDIIVTGTSASLREQMIKLKDIIRYLQEAEGSAHAMTIVDMAKEKGISLTRVDELLKKWQQEGEIYSPEKDRYKLVGG